MCTQFRYAALLVCAISLWWTPASTAQRSSSAQLLEAVIIGDSLQVLISSRGAEYHRVLSKEEVLALALRENVPPMVADSATGAKGRATVDRISKVTGRTYEIVMEENGFIYFFDVSKQEIAKVPFDLVRFIRPTYDVVFNNKSSAFTGVNIDSDQSRFDFLLQNSVSFVAGGAMIVFLLMVIIGGVVLKAKRERVRLLLSRQRMVNAREDERAGLAIDLHNGPLQDLAVLQMTPRGKDSLSNDLLDAAMETTREISINVRKVCSQLHAPKIEQEGLVACLGRLTGEIEIQSPRTIFHASIGPGGDNLAPGKSLTLYRSLQELLSNARNHAVAENVWIDFDGSAESARLSVKDDGIGFSFPTRIIDLEETGHLGLSFLAQRVEGVGGSLQIESSEGTGSEFIITMPVGVPKRNWFRIRKMEVA